jgi:hypothetical protein
MASKYFFLLSVSSSFPLRHRAGGLSLVIYMYIDIRHYSGLLLHLNYKVIQSRRAAALTLRSACRWWW